MPGMVGLELCRRLRTTRPTVEVVKVTGWASATTTAAAVEASVRRVFTKPVAVDFGPLIPFVEELVVPDHGCEESVHPNR